MSRLVVSLVDAILLMVLPSVKNHTQLRPSNGVPRAGVGDGLSRVATMEYTISGGWPVKGGDMGVHHDYSELRIRSIRTT